MLSITKRFTFDAAHCLPRHGGKCNRLHGHTYILEVTVYSTYEAHNLFVDQGFFIDFGDLNKVVKGVIDKYWDHYNLNETVDSYPTVERLILRMWASIRKELPSTCQLSKIKLHETPNSWADYDGHDLFCSWKDL